MKVIFDHQIFSLQRQGGISRYIFMLCQHLIALDVDAKIKVAWSENAYLKDKKSLPKFLPWRIRQLSYLLLNQLDDLLRPEKDIDLLHATYYGLTPLRKYAKHTTVTVFDMIHELGLVNPSIFDKTIKHKREILENIDVILAISNSTKKDVQRFYPNLNQVVHVTYLASDIDKYAESANTIEVNHNDGILYVGNRSGYKNFLPYLSAVADLLIEKNITLVAFGGGPFTSDEIKLISKLNLKNLVYQVSGNDKLLAKYYQKALFLVYPSLSEGFGLPIIEAFLLGCPVLTSNCSSMKEIARDSAILLDPSSPSSMRSATYKLLTDQALRLQLAESGLSRAESFTWENTAKQTLKLYQECLRSTS